LQKSELVPKASLEVVRIFLNMQADWRLIGALCAKQHEAWAYGRGYLTMEAYIR